MTSVANKYSDYKAPSSLALFLFVATYFFYVLAATFYHEYSNYQFVGFGLSVAVAALLTISLIHLFPSFLFTKKSAVEILCITILFFMISFFDFFNDGYLPNLGSFNSLIFTFIFLSISYSPKVINRLFLYSIRIFWILTILEVFKFFYFPGEHISSRTIPYFFGIDLGRNSLIFTRVGEAGYCYLLLLLFSWWQLRKIVNMYTPIFLFGMLLADSRAALLTGLIIFAVLGFFKLCQPIKSSPLTKLFFLFMFVFIGTLISYYVGFFDDVNVSNETVHRPFGRLTLVDVTLSAYSQNITLSSLMFGVTNFKHLLWEHGIYHHDTSHSFWVDVLVRYGIVGITGYFIALLALVASATRMPKPHRSYALACLAVFFSYQLSEPEFDFFSVTYMGMTQLMLLVIIRRYKSSI
jgi:hypothetical protein